MASGRSYSTLFCNLLTAFSRLFAIPEKECNTHQRCRQFHSPPQISPCYLPAKLAAHCIQIWRLTMSTEPCWTSLRKSKQYQMNMLRACLCSTWTDGGSGSILWQWNYTLTNICSSISCCQLGLSPIGLSCPPLQTVSQIWNITDSNAHSSNGEVRRWPEKQAQSLACLIPSTICLSFCVDKISIRRRSYPTEWIYQTMNKHAYGTAGWLELLPYRLNFSRPHWTLPLVFVLYLLHSAY